MNKKIFFTLLLGGLLTGCSTPAGVIEKRDIFVYVPPQELFNCPRTPIDVNADSLKDSQVSVIIRNLDADNRICRNSLAAVKESLTQAHKEFENGIKR